MRTEFFRKDKTKRVQFYVELRDMWTGVYWDTKAVYIVVFGLVMRVRRDES